MIVLAVESGMMANLREVARDEASRVLAPMDRFSVELEESSSARTPVLEAVSMKRDVCKGRVRASMSQMKAEKKRVTN